MPGVPSGKGCNACRKSRKKCDEAQASCLRCIRLGIECSGVGQRYVFKEMTLAKMPGSESTQLAKAFVKDVQIKDIRYDLAWVFGDVLEDVPQRLGSDKALDSAAKTFTAVIPFVRSGDRTEYMMKTYMDGLRSMSCALVSSSSSCRGNLWMAIYLMWICQAWFGRPDDFAVGHSQGISTLLDCEAIDDLEVMSSFDRKVLLSLVMPVLFDSMLDPSIEVTPGVRRFVKSFDEKLQWQRIVTSAVEIDLQGCYVWLTHTLIRLPDILREKHAYMGEAQELHRYGKAVLSLLQRTLASSETNVITNHHLRVEMLRTLCFAATCNLLLNIQLYASLHLLPQSDLSSSLEQEQDRLVKQITVAANKATIYRPLGAIYASMCLIIARPVARDPVDRNEIDRLLVEYQQDCQGAKISVMALQAEELVRSMLAAEDK